MDWSRAPSRLDWWRKLFHASGIAWWTPMVGKADAADLEYLRASILRDLAWVKGFTDRTDALDQVEADLSALLDWGDEDASQLLPVRYPWHIASGWTDYGAVRLALLAAIPAEARPSALAEMRSMEPLVLAGSRAKWNAQATELENKLAVAPTDPTIPHRLQALWREIDFGRNQFRVRVAKNTTITGLTWSLILAALLGVCVILQLKPDGEGTCVWLVALLGLLGGAMSALRSTDMIGGERRSIELEAARVRLRPLVGAAMGVVVYVVGRSSLAFELVEATPKSNAPIQIKVPDIAIAYYAFAFIAGFAERWFLKILDLVEGRVEAPPPPKPGGKAGGAGGSGGEVDAAVIKAHDAEMAAKDANETVEAAKKTQAEAEKAKQATAAALATAKATAEKHAAAAATAKAAAAKAKEDLAKQPGDDALQKASDAAADAASAAAEAAAAAAEDLERVETEAAKADKALVAATAAVEAAKTRAAAAKDYADKVEAAKNALVAVAKAEVAATAESTKATKAKEAEKQLAEKTARRAKDKAKEDKAKEDKAKEDKAKEAEKKKAPQ